MIPGIDVSHWEGAVDWPKVEQAGYRFTFCKASESNTYRDDTFKRNMSGARAYGLLAAPYHFYRAAIGPQAQADYFLRTIDGIELDLPPVLDFEDNHNQAPAQVAAALLKWLELVEAATGKRPLIYSSVYFWQTFAGSPAWSTDYPLWVANYSSAPNPWIPKPWVQWVFWQYTDRGIVPGVEGSCDVNWYVGDTGSLYALAGKVLVPEYTLTDVMKALSEIKALLKG